MTKYFTSWFAWLGVLIGFFSAVSAIQSVFSLGFSTFFESMLGFYRKLFEPLVLILNLLPFDITQTTVDMAALYIVFFMMSLRSSLVPLFFPEVLHIERKKISTRYIDTFPSAPQELPENTIETRTLETGEVEIDYLVFKPLWITYSRSILSCLLLIPAITLLPFRNLGFFKFLTWNIIRLAWSVEPEERSEEYLQIDAVSGGKVPVSIHDMLLVKHYIVVALQFFTLPFALMIFFILAEYHPL